MWGIKQSCCFERRVSSRETVERGYKASFSTANRGFSLKGEKKQKSLRASVTENGVAVLWRSWGQPGASQHA